MFLFWLVRESKTECEGLVKRVHTSEIIIGMLRVNEFHLCKRKQVVGVEIETETCLASDFLRQSVAKARCSSDADSQCLRG